MTFLVSLIFPLLERWRILLIRGIIDLVAWARVRACVYVCDTMALIYQYIIDIYYNAFLFRDIFKIHL